MLSLLLTLGSLQAVRGDTASYITTLGHDTVAVESVRRSTRRLEGEIVLRLPKTVSFHYLVDFDGAGNMTRCTAEQRPADQMESLQRTVTMTFAGDSVHVTVDSGSTRTSVTRAVSGRVVPMLMTGFGNSYGLYTSIGLYGLLLDQVPLSSGDTLELPAISVLSGRLGTKLVVRRSPARIDADYFRIGWTHLDLDDHGHIVRVDASSTTEQTLAVRTAWQDVRAFRKSFAQQDASGKALGVASPADSSRATIGDAQLSVAYSSPRLRGRRILGTVVPYGDVWRTGANAATVIMMDRDMTVGGVVVAAGSYSVWTMPTADSVVLLLNTQHGQWGTAHDSSKDRYRIPMHVQGGVMPLERFTIQLVNAGATGELRIAWDDFVWSVPLVPVK